MAQVVVAPVVSCSVNSEIFDAQWALHVCWGQQDTTNTLPKQSHTTYTLTFAQTGTHIYYYTLHLI